ncbi:MAG TPA: SLC13 family permease, partial [Rhizomicrobium sp.]
IAVNHLVWGRKLRASAADRARVMALDASREIKDKRLLTYSVWVIGLLIAGFALGEMLHLRAATIALFGGATMLLLDNFRHHRHKHNENILAILNDVEWITIFFFVGLFVVVGGVEKAGLLSYLAGKLTAATGGDMKLTALGILWASAGASAIIDNIPFVATMIPLLKTMAPGLGGVTQMDPVWWSLALGACLGGNGTLIGASANLVVAGQAEKQGVRFSFVKFALLAFPMMLMSIAICHFYILWRYF